MKNQVQKIGEKKLEKVGSDLLDLTVISGMRNGHIGSQAIGQATKNQIEISGRQFNQWASERGLTKQEINPEMINLFLNSYNWKPATRNRKRNDLIQLLKNQSNDIRFRLLVSESAKQIETVKVEKAVTRDEFLTVAEIDRLIQNTKKEKTRLMIEFLFQTGCRVSEMIYIRLDDVKVNGQAKINVVGKGNKERVVYCKKELYFQILATFGGAEYLFCTTARGKAGKVKYNRVNIFRILALAGKKAGLNIHPHTFRHSCAMHLQESGKSAQYIQKYLGHSSVAITLDHYFHDKPGEEILDCF